MTIRVGGAAHLVVGVLAAGALMSCRGGSGSRGRVAQQDGSTPAAPNCSRATHDLKIQTLCTDRMLLPLRDTFERIARGDQVNGQPATQAERAALRDLLRSDIDLVVALAAWALVRVGDVESLPLLAQRYAADRSDPERFEISVEEAFLRTAPLRLRPPPPAEAQATWARMLVSDNNPVVQAEAAKEVAALRHPQALALLRQVVDDTSGGRRGYKATIQGQVAVALGTIPGAASGRLLKELLREGSGPGGVYSIILKLEVCHELLRPDARPCEQSVRACAERALERHREYPCLLPQGCR